MKWYQGLPSINDTLAPPKTHPIHFWVVAEANSDFTALRKLDLTLLEWRVVSDFKFQYIRVFFELQLDIGREG